MSRPTLAALLLSMLATVALAACGDDTDTTTPDETDTARTPTAETRAETAPTEPAVMPEGFTLVTIVVTDADGDQHEICVWLADTAVERSRGLMGVTDLGGAEGMLFAYDEPATSRFWMFGTPMPLSIAFFAADGSLVSTADMEPCLDTPADRCRRYPPDGEYTHALEVAQGDLTRLGVGDGASLRVLDDAEDSCPTG